MGKRSFHRKTSGWQLGFFIVGHLLFLSSLKGSTIDILTNFWNDLPSIELQNDPVNRVEFRILNVELNDYLEHYFTSDVEWVIIMNQQNSTALAKLPKEKLVLFVWEPDEIGRNYYERFSRVYTYNDNKIDNIKYFKFCYPFLNLPTDHSVPFGNRKLCTLVARHWIPKRLQILDFFNSLPEDTFEFYGTLPSIAYRKMYRGKISGTHSGEEKIRTLQGYRFCICFENSSIPGYITEKIFSCFASGCVPIYLGAPNITDYIPADCFIDYRMFKSNGELYRFLQGITEERYRKYLERISLYLTSDKATRFSSENFKKIFYGLKK